MIESQAGIEGGLMLLIDNNFERSITPDYKQETSESAKKFLSFEQIDDTSRASAQIYVPTLAPYFGSQPAWILHDDFPEEDDWNRRFLGDARG